MKTEFDFKEMYDPRSEERIVYVRPVALDSLPENLRADLGEAVATVYAVHDASGERLALVRDRRMAFALAREHDLAPVNVH